MYLKIWYKIKAGIKYQNKYVDIKYVSCFSFFIILSWYVNAHNKKIPQNTALISHHPLMTAFLGLITILAWFELVSLFLISSYWDKYPLQKTEWIINKVNSVWYNAMYFISLNLICKYVIMNIFILKKGYKISYIPLYDLLFLVSIFKSGFNKLIFKRKSMLFIIDVNTDLSWKKLDVHKYNSDFNIALPPLAKYINLPDSISTINLWAYTAFIKFVNKTKMIYNKAANKEEKVILKMQAKKMELLQDIEFLP